MKLLLIALMSLAVFCANAQSYSQRVYPASCDQENMISNQGQHLYQFSFASDCVAALNQSKNNSGHFCDYEVLVRRDGVMAHRFSFFSECLSGLTDMRMSNHGLFCSDGNAYQIWKSKIATFTFQSICRDALRDAGTYQGRFCQEGVMLNYLGKVIKDYTFNSTCRSALLRNSSVPRL